MIDDPEEYCDDGIAPLAPPIGSSFDDLVTYFAALPAYHRERRRDGRWLPREAPRVLAVRIGRCRLSPVWTPSDVWILDVDGVHLMIGSDIGGDRELDVPKTAAKAEIRQMVESIHFER